MKRRKQTRFCIPVCMLAAFMLWTVLMRVVDVQAIGPMESEVGFATINRFVHNLTGVHWYLYQVTDWLSIVPVLFVAGFALLGLVQWIQRKSLRNVDFSLLALGGLYITVMVIFAFFEMAVINYRPVLIDGNLEASYPSSTTMLVMCVMPTAIVQLNDRMKRRIFRRCVVCIITAFVAFMVIGRMVSGVHWFTDIVGGALLSLGLVMMYRAVCRNR